MWDGDVLAGPVPTVFAEVVEEAVANMAEKHRQDPQQLLQVWEAPRCGGACRDGQGSGLVEETKVRKLHQTEKNSTKNMQDIDMQVNI